MLDLIPPHNEYVNFNAAQKENFALRMYIIFYSFFFVEHRRVFGFLRWMRNAGCIYNAGIIYFVQD